MRRVGREDETSGAFRNLQKLLHCCAVAASLQAGEVLTQSLDDNARHGLTGFRRDRLSKPMRFRILDIETGGHGFYHKWRYSTILSRTDAGRKKNFRQNDRKTMWKCCSISFVQWRQNARVRALEVIGVTETEDADRQGRAGRLSWFLWRPWYAKLWWRAAALFWLMAFFVEWLAPDWSRSMSDDLRFALMIIFHPFTIIPALGLRLYWRWVASDTFAWPSNGKGEDGFESEWHYDVEGIGSHRNSERSLGHPLNPRSPLNPINPLYRIHHRHR